MAKYRLIWIGWCCLMFWGCSERLDNRISIGVVSGWAEGEAMTLIAQEVFSRAGYHVVLQKATPDLLFASMNNGDTDLYLDVWLPQTHGNKIARFDKIHSTGVIYEGARTGLVVPDYVDIRSIEDLNPYRNRFQGRIIGIERGSGAAAATDEVLKEYDLNYVQMNSSSVAMISELQNAIEKKEWIVVTGWKPHWMFSRFDLKFLDDPKLVYGEAEHIEPYAREGLQQDFPEVYRFLERIFFDDETLSDLLDSIRKSDNKRETAKAWVDAHTDLIDSRWGREEPDHL